MTPERWSVKQAAQFLGIGKTAMYDLLAIGKIRHYRPVGYHIVIDAADVKAHWRESRVDEPGDLAQIRRNRLKEGKEMETCNPL